MGYVAKLYIGDCLYRTIALNEGEVRDYIVLYVQRTLQLTAGEITPDTEMRCDQMVFRINLDRRREQYALHYDFDTVTGSLRLSEYEVHEVFPSSLNEPSKNVNLGKLKDKLRSKENMTKLLLRFFRAE